MPVTLHPVSETDRDFLYEVYASTRRDELAACGWDTAQQDAFIRMQYDIQQRAYQMQHPEATYQVIKSDSTPVGRFIVARSDNSIQLVDIALLPEYRNRGIGSALIKDLLEESRSSNRAVRLQVIKTNPAALLYGRLGFVKTGESGMHYKMEYRSPAT